MQLTYSDIKSTEHASPRLEHGRATTRLSKIRALSCACPAVQLSCCRPSTGNKNILIQVCWDFLGHRKWIETVGRIFHISSSTGNCKLFVHLHAFNVRISALPTGTGVVPAGMLTSTGNSTVMQCLHDQVCTIDLSRVSIVCTWVKH